MEQLEQQLHALREDYAFKIKRLEDEITAQLDQIEKICAQHPEVSERLHQAISENGQMPHPLESTRIGERMLLLGWINARHLDRALKYQRTNGGLLGEILIELGFVRPEQLEFLLARTDSSKRLGQLLVAHGYLLQSDVDRALELQQQSGGSLGEILISLKLITPRQFYRELASQHRIGRLSESIDGTDDYKLPEAMARKYNAIVVNRQSTRCVLAVEKLLDEEQRLRLEAHIGLPILQVLASPWEMEKLWNDIYHRELLHESTEKLKQQQPENSASVTFTVLQIVIAAVLAAVVIGGLIANWFAMLLILNVIIQLFYFTMTVMKFMIIIYGTRHEAQIRISEEELRQLNERELPVYTILVPMYKESEVIPHLAQNLNRLDYPKHKLDVRLLIEEDDVESLEVIRSLSLPLYFKTIIVPHSLPKTKPKACNYGLARARGEYVVIYDAEDRPDPDQLKKVVAAFKKNPDNCVCIQAKLNYFNSNQNLLTRFFTQEYSNWFELLLPGVMQLKIPVPLGGTSNHFKTSILQEMDAWDPYNVTEDADLGIRLYKKGYTTGIVNSRTLEEANSRYGNWIRQRSRWIKGYMQTWLVHMRNPLKLYREVGARGFWGVQLMLLSSPMLPMLNPIFWSLIILWYVTHAGWIPSFFPGYIYYLAAAQLLLGNFLFVYMNMAGAYWIVHDLHMNRERWLSFGLIKYALLTPVYWVMMSIAAVKALWQLITKPFYWEKTTHGLTTPEQQNRSLNA
ncbi:glycosyltransferase family 2 protein [Paenibacillus beijingensis]|uniref:glycosyltransferase family 2 protein n=1 Tax=Paenibacillus beijingensis TaxID=1126833 RepID=UPI001EE719BB|nr:glycosyltransferase family 2 protein [Paenibacillus beijingensis]